MSKRPWVPPRWDVPFPYSHSAAVDNMGSIAAPLFTGFSVAIAFQVLTREQDLRWPNVALTLLLAAAFLLGASVQFAFRTRQYVVTPPEIEMWFPDPTDNLRDEMRREQRYHRVEYRKWSDLTRLAYNLGLLFLLLGIWVALVPPDPIERGRYLPIALAALAFAAEAAWVLWSTYFRPTEDEPLEFPDADPSVISTVESG